MGVALFGALFSSRLADLLGDAAPTGLTPEAIGQLPSAELAQMASAFSDSITMVFGYAVLLLVVGFLLTWLLRESPLRTASGTAQRDMAAEPAGPVAVDAQPSAGHGQVGSLPADTIAAVSDPAIVVDCGPDASEDAPGGIERRRGGPRVSVGAEADPVEDRRRAS